MKWIGLDCNIAEIRGVVCDSSGAKLNAVHMAADLEQGALQYIQKIQSLLSTLIQRYPSIHSVGVATVGRVDERNRLVTEAPAGITGYEGTDFYAVAGAIFPCSVIATNRTRAALAGEQWLGAAQGLERAALLILDDTVDGAVLTGQCLREDSRDSAEDSRRLFPDDAVKHRLSARTFYGAMTQVLGYNASCERFLEEYAQGNPSVRQVAEAYAETLASALIHIQTVFHPEAVILGGALADWYDAILPTVSRALTQQNISLRVLKTQLGADMACLGAAHIGFEARPASFERTH